MDHKVTVVIPIYADWPSLSDCLDSLFEHVDFSLHTLLLVNDNGPDAGQIEKNIKQKIKERENVTYSRNPKNLGFVGTCNRAALELDTTENDILLLNSDTVVTEGFLNELLEVMYSNGKIGAVTPRTNNATIATIPLRTAKDKGIDPKKSYEIFQEIKGKLPRYSEVPTAHGYCMLIRRKLIKKYDLFDEVFGKGYCEENDFCLRIQSHSYKCVLANRAYVYHLEARSFTSEAKAKILEKNLAILYERWPNYREQVRDYMEKAIPFETSLETTTPKINTKVRLKKLLQRNPKLYGLAKKVKNSGKS